MASNPTLQTQFAQKRHSQYRDFIEHYTEGSDQPHYLQLIRDAVRTRRYFVPINLQSLFNYQPQSEGQNWSPKDLYWDTIKYPDEMIPVIGDCICQIATEIFPDFREEIDDNMRVCMLFLQ